MGVHSSEKTDTPGLKTERPYGIADLSNSCAIIFENVISDQWVSLLKTLFNDEFVFIYRGAETFDDINQSNQIIIAASSPDAELTKLAFQLLQNGHRVFIGFCNVDIKNFDDVLACNRLSHSGAVVLSLKSLIQELQYD